MRTSRIDPNSLKQYFNAPKQLEGKKKKKILESGNLPWYTPASSTQAFGRSYTLWRCSLLYLQESSQVTKVVIVSNEWEYGIDQCTARYRLLRAHVPIYLCVQKQELSVPCKPHRCCRWHSVQACFLPAGGVAHHIPEHNVHSVNKVLTRIVHTKVNYLLRL